MWVIPTGYNVKSGDPLVLIGLSKKKTDMKNYIEAEYIGFTLNRKGLSSIITSYKQKYKSIIFI